MRKFPIQSNLSKSRDLQLFPNDKSVFQLQMKRSRFFPVYPGFPFKGVPIGQVRL